MSTGDLLLWAGILFIALPVCAYMVMKFGAAGYFRAKRREQEKQTRGHNEPINK